MSNNGMNINQDELQNLIKKGSFGYEDICKVIPQRPPFLMIDKVIELDVPNKRVVCVKGVSANEWFFQGHFPNNPIMPGVLLLEAMAQASSIIGRFLMQKDGVLLFAGIDDVKFLDVVKTGDQLVVEVQVSAVRDPLIKGDCIAKVDNKIVASCTLKAFRKELNK